jgi:hypothetical protein
MSLPVLMLLEQSTDEEWCLLGCYADVSEEPGASFIKVTKIGELGTTQAATSNRRTLRRNTKKSHTAEQPRRHHSSF